MHGDGGGGDDGKGGASDVAVGAGVVALLTGVFGGVLGAVFVILNVKIAALRQKLIAHSKRRRVAEVSSFFSFHLARKVVIVTALFSTAIFVTPLAFPCTPRAPSNSTARALLVRAVERFNCPQGSFNEAAALLLLRGESTMQELLAKSPPPS
jgi:hypothetical protein